MVHTKIKLELDCLLMCCTDLMDEDVNVVSDNTGRHVVVPRVVEVIVIFVEGLLVVELASQVQQLFGVQVVDDLLGHVHLRVCRPFKKEMRNIQICNTFIRRGYFFGKYY